jgi:hypothetical protein
VIGPAEDCELKIKIPIEPFETIFMLIGSSYKTPVKEIELPSDGPVIIQNGGFSLQL